MLFNLKMGKKGLSIVVASLLMIVLVVVAVGIIWGVTSNLINKQLESASCVDLMGKVKIGGFTRYVYDDVNKFLLVQIEREDVDLKKVSVSLTSSGITKSFDIYEGKITYDGDTRLDEPVNWMEGVENAYRSKLPLYFPKKNEARVYLFDMNNIEGMNEKPDVINLYPYSNNEKCPSVDTMTDIPSYPMATP